MTTLLFSMIAAASLAAAASVTPGETRSAQSLPTDHLVVASPNIAATGTLHTVNRLADGQQGDPGQDQADKLYCEHHSGHWDDVKKRCRHVLAWPVPVIGAATTAGFIYALTSHNGSPSGQPSISN